MWIEMWIHHWGNIVIQSSRPDLGLLEWILSTRLLFIFYYCWIYVHCIVIWTRQTRVQLLLAKDIWDSEKHFTALSPSYFHVLCIYLHHGNDFAGHVHLSIVHHFRSAKDHPRSSMHSSKYLFSIQIYLLHVQHIHLLQ